jgi:hypothetical protein
MQREVVAVFQGEMGRKRNGISNRLSILVRSWVRCMYKGKLSLATVEDENDKSKEEEKV